MTQHAHSRIVIGCYRCDLSNDEVSDTVTGLDLTEVADAADDLLGMCSEAGYRDAVGILVAAVPSLLAAARAVEAVRVAVHLDDDEPINLLAVPGGYKQPFCDGWDAAVDHMRGLVRAALGTEQEGRD